MTDAELRLDKGDSIKLNLDGGALFIWNDNGRVSISVESDNADSLQVMVDEETMAVLYVTSPAERIRVPVKSWQDALRLIAEKARVI